MSRRIADTVRTAERNEFPMWTLAMGIALIALLIWTPITALAEDAETGYNGWMLQDVNVVSLPESLDATLNLDERSLEASWQEEHSRGLSVYTWDYDLNLSWSEPPSVLAAGQAAPLSWEIENANLNPLIPQESLAWSFYAPELRWAGLGDADTLPCDHSPAYVTFDGEGANHTCDAITRAPESADDRMAIIYESGIYQNGEWHNIMVQYTYAPATLDQDYVDSVSELATVADSTARFLQNQTVTIYCSNDCGIGVWATQI